MQNNAPITGFANSDDENICRNMIAELVDYAILDVCVQVHKSIKMGYFVREETKKVEPESIKVDYKNSTVICPACKKLCGAAKYSDHLSKCVGGHFRQVASSTKSDVYDEKDSSSHEKRPKRMKINNEKPRDKKKVLLSQIYGVIPTQNPDKMCSNSLNFSHHSDDTNREIRNYFLSEKYYQGENGQMDVDTVDQVL